MGLFQVSGARFVCASEGAPGMAEEFGIEVVDVRIKSIELPDDVRESVFRRMQADRQKAANLYRFECREAVIQALKKEGLLESPDRGVYQPGPKSKALTRRVQGWKDVSSRIVPWNGDWLVALTRHLGRSDRKQLRARERALALFGYQQTEEGFWVRPANLAGDLESHRAGLTEIGADEEAVLAEWHGRRPGGGVAWRSRVVKR